MNHFNMNNFMPHGHCYLWQTDILLMNVISDVIISICYFAIPFILAVILHKRKDLPFRSTIRVFAVFIFFCSLTHIMEIVNVWYPFYYFTGLLKVVTASISVFSAWLIINNLSKILALPSMVNLKHRLFSNVHQVMEKLPIGVILSDEKGKINYHNEYINELFKYNKVDLHEKDVEILISDVQKSDHIAQKESYLKAPTEKTMGGGRILKGITKEGESKLLEIGLRPISIQSSNLVLVAIKDITEEEERKKKIEETLKLINVATYGMPSLLSYIDKDGLYQYINGAYSRKWDTNAEAMLGKNYKDLLPPDTVTAIESKMNAALTGEKLNFKLNVDFPLEGLRKLDVFYIPYISIETNQVEGVVVLAHDITELDDTLKELEQSNKQLEEYAFLVSHDLRAPVRHISNFVELLLEQINLLKINNEKIDQFSTVVMENTIKLQNMISGILKIASITQIVPEYVELDIRSFIENIISEFDSVNSFELFLADDKVIFSDRDLLESIFTNLIKNSVSYSKPGEARIEIHVKIESNILHITYQDYGLGITPEFAKNMFNPFIKSKESTGLGLGMTIISRSLEQINGTIRFIDAQQGARFELEILLPSR